MGPEWDDFCADAVWATGLRSCRIMIIESWKSQSQDFVVECDVFSVGGLLREEAGHKG